MLQTGLVRGTEMIQTIIVLSVLGPIVLISFVLIYARVAGRGKRIAISPEIRGEIEQTSDWWDREYLSLLGYKTHNAPDGRLAIEWVRVVKTMCVLEASYDEYDRKWGKGTSRGMADRTGMEMSGFCEWPSPGSHEMCYRFVTRPCACECHTEEKKQ